METKSDRKLTNEVDELDDLIGAENHNTNHNDDSLKTNILAEEVAEAVDQRTPVTMLSDKPLALLLR